MSESNSSSSISSSLSAFEIENTRSSTTILASTRKKEKTKNTSSTNKVQFQEVNNIPYISQNFEKNENNTDDTYDNDKELDLYPIFKSVKTQQNIQTNDKEFQNSIDNTKELENNISVEDKTLEEKIFTEIDMPETIDIDENNQFETKNDNIFVKDQYSASDNLKNNINEPSIPKNHFSPKEDSKITNRNSGVSERSNMSTSRVQFQHSPKDDTKLNNRQSNISDKSNNKPYHSPKDFKNQIPSFSPPNHFNNTEYIQRMLRPDEYQKSPDDKDKNDQKRNTPIKSQQSDFSRKSIHSNISKHSSQQIKPSPHYSNVSRQSVLSNQSRQSHHSHISKKSDISIVSKRTSISDVSKNSSSIVIRENDKEKGIYIAKYYILKDMYPRMNIQIPDDSYSIDRIKEEYNELYKKVCADKFAGEYRTYMAIAFAVIEVVLCKVFKLNATGFTKFHLKRIHQYNESLLLLGENTAAESTVRNPFSEIVTAGAINTIFFVLIKYVGSYLSEDTAEKVIQGILDSINTNVDNNIDIHGLNPENIGDYVDTFMKIIPDKKENNNKSSKKPQMKRPTYNDE